MIRISAGRFRGRRLSVPAGVRPSSARVREAVFDILGARIELEGIRFLDLYAGSGAVGIEALSRGAREVVFVEADLKAVAAIHRNLAALGVEGPAASVVPVPAASFRRRGFDAAFADPPFGENRWDEAAAALAKSLAPGGLGILQAARGVPPPAAEGLTLVRSYRHGTSTLHLFLRAAL